MPLRVRRERAAFTPQIQMPKFAGQTLTEAQVSPGARHDRGPAVYQHRHFLQVEMHPMGNGDMRPEHTQ